jgi:hypothetical protein
MTAVGVGVAYAATFTLTSAHLGAAGVTPPVMFPVSVTTANHGTLPGKVEKLDTVTFVWSRVLDETTVCSGWSNAQTTHTLSMSWVIQQNTGSTGNDVLVPGATGATCSSGLHVGSVDLGAPGYINTANGTIAASATVITVGSTTTTLTVTFGGAPTGGTAGTVLSGVAATWTPDSAVTDTAGHNCGSNLARSSATVQF